MLPEEFRIKEYDQAIKLLDDIKAEVEAGNILSVTVACETTSGDLFGGCTACQNVFQIAGYMIAWALERMHFTNSKMFNNPLGEKEGPR